jgi:hypothetical protein
MCQSGGLDDLRINSDDRIIFHFTRPVFQIRPAKAILSCHETNIFELRKFPQNEPFCNSIHFVSESQRDWQKCDLVDNLHTFVIPNVVTKLVSDQQYKGGVAGVVGSIDSHKQTHVSIQRALAAGYRKVIIFGYVTDNAYFKEYVEPLLSDTVAFMGAVKNQQTMYNMLDAVFHSSKRETYNLVQKECAMAGIEYHGLPTSDSAAEMWNDDQIFDAWMKELA